MRSLLSALVLVWSLEGGDARPVLALNESGCFRMLMFADMHYGEGEAVGWGREQDVNTTRVQNIVLQAESPDFVVMLGDMITGNNVASNASAYWNEFTAPVRTNFSMPWATVLGNHDDYALQPLEANSRPKGHSDSGMPDSMQQAGRGLTAVDRRTLLGYDLEFANSLTQQGPASISLVSNYFLPVLPAGGVPGMVPAMLLYFLDTGGGRSPEIVYPDQVAWLQQTRQSHLAKWGGNVTALLFMHIPCAQYSEALGSKDGFFGMAQDGITPTVNDTGLFDVLRDSGITATFVGHDHGNDFCGKVQGVWLCYGRHSGYGGYGSWRRGARVLQYCADVSKRSLETWVRLEDEAQIDRGVLL